MSDLPLARLDQIVSLMTEKVTTSKVANQAYIGLEHLPRGGSQLLGFAEATQSISTNNIFREGDVLFGKLRPRLRKSIRAPFTGYCSTDILVLRPAMTVDPEFAVFILQSDPVFDEAVRTEEGTKMPRCTWSKLRNFLVYCPDTPTQKRIAEILSTVDEAIETTRALIAKIRAIKAGLMHDLFTRGVTAEGHLRPPREQAPHLYKQSPLGWIPKEWDVLQIGELFGRRIERGRPGLPIMSVTMQGGLVPRSDLDRRVESNLTPEQHLLVVEGDIAYNMMRMWQGVLGRARYNCLVSPAYVVMTPTPRIESRFAEGLLSLPESIAKFKRMSYGIVDDRLRLYADDLLRIELAYPVDFEEQVRIANSQESISEESHALTNELRKLRQLKCGLMHDLLTGRVTVPLAKIPELTQASATGRPLAPADQPMV